MFKIAVETSRSLWSLKVLFPCNIIDSNQIYLVTLGPTQLTKASFLQKNQMLQNGFLIPVTLRWHSGFKNYEIWTLKVNFLCQKTSEFS